MLCNHQRLQSQWQPHSQSCLERSRLRSLTYLTWIHFHQACKTGMISLFCRKVHLQAEPIDVYLEASIFEELKHFVNSITSLPFSSTTAAAHKQQKTTALLLRQMIQTATVQTTIVDPKDVAGKFGKWHFGKWCASPVA